MSAKAVSYAAVLDQAAQQLDQLREMYEYQVPPSFRGPSIPLSQPLRALAALVEEAESSKVPMYTTSDHSDWGRNADAVKAKKFLAAFQAGYTPPEDGR